MTVQRIASRVARKYLETKLKLASVKPGDTVLYKGRKYKVQYAGKTKFGLKAKLSFMDGSKEFWVPLNAVQPTRSSGGSSVGRTRLVRFQHSNGRIERMDEGQAEVLEDMGHGMIMA